ncbi:MAG: glycosyltransferase [Candidatus Krumholzibacteria bacterium]|nr:glycosyltransferase [Candidatus Krumholzibacteria bacterium]
MSTDLITIGITCFDAEDSVEKAVRSAQEQTWPSLEIVAVDDCSSDGSWSILERLASADGRMRIIRHSVNCGVGAARNTVLQHASGAFVAFFDDDDVSRPQRLAVQHRRIVDYERATGAKSVLGYTATAQLYPNGAGVYSPCLGADATPAPSGQDVARLILLGKPAGGGRGVCPTSSLMARREVLGSVGGFDEDLRRHEDTDLNLRLALQGAHFAGLSDPLVKQTMTFTRDKTVLAERQSAFHLLEKHEEVLRRWQWYEFSYLWCEMKFAWLEGGLKTALPIAARMFLASPGKMARKALWALPNRKHYRRHKYSSDERA